MSEVEIAPSAMADIDRLEDVLERNALSEVCRSFFDLFGISIRVVSASGALLSDVHEEQAICRYVNTLEEGTRACAATVNAVKDLQPRDSEIVHPCFTGAVYRVVPIDYQGRSVGRFVIGPYLPVEKRSVPRSLLTVDPALDAEEARAELAKMPRVRDETAERITAHLRGMIDLIVFAGHRARLTSEMHIASVRESYRELAEKTAQLQQAFDRLKELDRLKSNFLATVSHELRTPLTSIIGYSEMLSTGIAGGLNEEQLEFVETIRGKGDHLLALISSLLDMSKLEQGQLTLQRERTAPRALVEDVLATVRLQAERKKVRVDAEVDDATPPLVVDPVRIKQVLINLIDNAIKFTAEGGTVRIRARSTEIESQHGGLGAVLMATPRRAIEFSIRDTGIGISSDQVDKIFDAFYQVDGSSTREHGGAGLGLSIVRRLVEAHDGTVDVTSQPGEGTTFVVVFPELDEEE